MEDGLDVGDEMMLRSTHCLAACLTAAVVVAMAAPADAEILEEYGDCFLENRNGLLVLHLSGTPEEMGYAHGQLLAEEARAVYQGLAKTLRREMSTDDQAAVAANARPHVPERFVTEVFAIAAGVNDAIGETAISADRLLELHSWDEICRDRMDRGPVAHFAAMSGGTADGHVIVGIDQVDEQCIRRDVQKGAVVIIYEPAGGHTFCTPSWAGFAGAMCGINSQGLVVSKARFPSNEQTTNGMPCPFQIRTLLEETSDVASAEATLRALARTVSGNVLVADGVGTPAVRAFEMTHSRFEVFQTGDPGENQTYDVAPESVPVTINIDDLSFDLTLPEGTETVTHTFSRPLPNAIVRASGFVHYGPGSLQEQQALWAMGFIGTDPDFDFLDISGLAPGYEYPSLSLMYLTNKILSGRARDLLNPGLVGVLDLFLPGWDMELFFPDSAAPARYTLMGNLLEERLGTLDPSGAVNILNGGGAPLEPVDVLRDPNSLYAIVIDATTMELWIATAPPRDAGGKPDAGLQTFRKLDFGALATYPLTVETTPVAGEVFVNGASWGDAPQTRYVEPGQYTLSFGPVDGYVAPVDQIVTVDVDGAAVTGSYEKTYALTVNVVGSGSVAADPNDGEYVDGDVVTLTATPDTGWYLVGWSGDGDGNLATLKITIEEDTQVTATFAEIPPAQYSLTVEIVGDGEIAPSGGTYQENFVETLTVDAAGGWHFVRWEEDAQGTDPTTQVTFDSDKLVRGVFAQGTYQLDVTIVGQGAVEPSNGGHEPGEVLTLQADPADGWRFVGWSGDVTGAEPTAVLEIAGDAAVTATFGQVPAGSRSLTVQTEGAGSVEPGSGVYDDGEEVVLTATPARCWQFVGWTGDLESTDASITFPLTGDKTLRAVFAESSQVVLDVTKQGEGTVTLDPPSGTYACGTQVTLEASVAEASVVWQFKAWQGDVASQENPLTVTVESDMEILAVFSQTELSSGDLPEPAGCCGASAAPATVMLLIAGLLMTSRGGLPRRGRRAGRRHS